MKNYVHFLKIWYNNNINKMKTPRREKKHERMDKNVFKSMWKQRIKKVCK